MSVLTERCRIYIAAPTFSEQRIWAELSECYSSLYFVEADNCFWKSARLDIEIMATSIVLMRTGLAAPELNAGVYRFKEGSGYAPTVVVPPVVPLDFVPPFIPVVDRSRLPEGLVGIVDARGFRIAVNNWRQVLAKVLELRLEAETDPRVGFNCDTTGYLDLSEIERCWAFEIAYAEYTRDIDLRLEDGKNASG